jgi:hypothetical protein
MRCGVFRGFEQGWLPWEPWLSRLPGRLACRHQLRLCRPRLLAVRRIAVRLMEVHLGKRVVSRNHLEDVSFDAAGLVHVETTH